MWNYKKKLIKFGTNTVVLVQNKGFFGTNFGQTVHFVPLLNNTFGDGRSLAVVYILFCVFALRQFLFVAIIMVQSVIAIHRVNTR